MTEDEFKEERRQQEDVERYERAAHAVQTGVAYQMEREPAPTTPKHLRTGIDLSKADMEGLVTLLIEKGVITRAEYLAAIADSAEREKARYQARVSQLYGGANIVLA